MQGAIASHVRPATFGTPDLLGVLRARKAQAQNECEPYLAPVLERDAMLYWLARAAVGAREAAGRKQVHIAASANRDQSSIYRFEQAAKGKGGWPRDADRIVAAYADDLDIDSIELWTMALQLWRDDRAREPEAITSRVDVPAEDSFPNVPGARRGLRAGVPRPPATASKPVRKRSPKAAPPGTP